MENEKNLTVLKNKKRKMRIIAIIAAVLAGYLLWRCWPYIVKGTTTEAMGANVGSVYSPDFNKSGDTINPNKALPFTFPKGITNEKELIQLAKDTKNSGLILQGVTACGWSRKQREMFGPMKSEARKIIESIYTECVSRDICPGITGYPTWIKVPGFKDAAALRNTIKSSMIQPLQPMLQGNAAPNEENLPNRKHAVQPIEDPKDVNIKQQSNDKIDSIVIKEIEEDPVEIEEPKLMKSSANKENARGVSNYPPASPMDMPGTSGWHLNETQASNQFSQGNVPRLSIENHEPVFALARQMASTFSALARDQARDPRSSAYSSADYPQARSVSTGEGFNDKRIYTEINV